MAYRSLGTLRALVLARIGMSAMGASGGAAGALLDSWLIEGQALIYWMQDWKHLTSYYDASTGVGQNLYDYPAAATMPSSGTGCPRNKRVLRLETVISGQYSRLVEGIRTEDWSTMETQAPPSRFDRLAQIMVYPKSDAIYTLRIWYVADLGAFSVDTDLCTMDDDMVLLYGTAMAKSHYRQPDAKLYQDQLDTLLASIRGQSFGSGGVYRRDGQPPAERKPLLLGRDA